MFGVRLGENACKNNHYKAGSAPSEHFHWICYPNVVAPRNLSRWLAIYHHLRPIDTSGRFRRPTRFYLQEFSALFVFGQRPLYRRQGQKITLIFSHCQTQVEINLDS